MASPSKSSPSSSTRSRISEFNSRVTLFEAIPTAQAATSTSITSATTRNAKASTSKRLRSVTPEIEEDLEEEYKPQLSNSRKKSKSPTKKSVKNEVEVKEENVLEGEDIKPKKSPSPRKPKPFINSLAKPHPEPAKWKIQYEMIKEARKSIVAAVDLMGCVQGGREPGEEVPNEKDNKLSILVSLMLSSQTKDPVTHQAVVNLRTMLRGGLTIDSLIDSTPEEINACINKVGFHNVKTANLVKLASKLKADYNGEVPEDLPSLLALSGVGPKMAILFMNSVGKPSGIGVDVHVHRITNRLGWHKTTTPEQTRLNLESWLPKEFHGEINVMLVGFGQAGPCRPVAPRCDLCPLSSVPRLCPSKETISSKKIAARSPEKPLFKFEVKEELAEGKPKVEVSIESQAVFGVKQEEGADDDIKTGVQLLW